MSDPNAQPIAGWYPDPENEAGDRWWNGATWSDHRRARNAGPGWAPAAGTPAAAAGGAAAGAAPAPDAAPSIPVPPAAEGAMFRPNPYAGTVVPPAAAQTYPGAAAPGVQPYAPPYAYNYAPRTPMQNVPAFAGMITSLSAILFNWILFGLPGIVGGGISIVGLLKANKLAAAGVTVGNGRGFALAGIISGFLGALLWDLFYFTTFAPLTFS